MRKRILLFLLSLMAITLLLFIGCDSETDTENLRIILDKEVSRTIVPSDLELSITGYRITCIGPDNRTQEFTTKRSTFLLEGVQVGTWNITAEGCNDSGTALVRGSTVFQLNKTNTSATVILNELIGSGALNLVYTWDSTSVESPTVEISIQDQSGNSYLENRQLTVSNSSACLNLTGMPAGSYVVQAILYDNGIKAAGYTEAIRIVDNKTTSGTLSFNVDALPAVVGQLTLENKAGTPIVCSIQGITAGQQVAAQEDLTVTLDTSSFSSQDVNISWYLDSVLIGTTASITFAPAPGEHRLDVIASTNALGATGSTSIAFEAALLGETGVPVLASTIAGSSSLRIGGRNTVEFLSDGNLLLTSDGCRTASICSIQRNTLVAQTSISYDYPVMDAVELNGYSKIVLLFENVPFDGLTRAITARYAYDGSSMTLTKEVQGRGLITASSDERYIVTPIGLIRNSNTLYGNFGFVGFSNLNRNYVLFRSLENTDAQVDGTSSYYIPGRTINGNSSITTPFSLLSSSHDGERSVLVNPDSGYLTFLWNGSSNYAYVNSCFEAISGATALSILPCQTGEVGRAAVLSGQNIYIYSTDGETVSLQETIVRDGDEGSNPGTTKMLPTYDEDYVYFLNTGSNSISTWRVTDGSLEFVGVTETGFAPARAAISPSGVYLFCCAEDSSTLTMFRIKTE